MQNIIILWYSYTFDRLNYEIIVVEKKIDPLFIADTAVKTMWADNYLVFTTIENIVQKLVPIMIHETCVFNPSIVF